MFHFTPLPPVLVRTFGYTLAWMEPKFGLLVLLGLLYTYALGCGALLIFVLIFWTTLRQDWETAELQLTYALPLSALLALSNGISVR